MEYTCILRDGSPAGKPGRGRSSCLAECPDTTRSRSMGEGLTSTSLPVITDMGTICAFQTMMSDANCLIFPIFSGTNGASAA